MTPVEYARMIQADVQDTADVSGSSTAQPAAPKLKMAKFPYLTGKHIFYAGGDMRHASEATRKKMDIVRAIYVLLGCSPDMPPADC